MKHPLTAGRILLTSLLCVLCGVRIGSQTVPALEKINSQEELDKAIASLDGTLFDAYNRCDLEKFAALLSENVEFYHDQGGLTVGRTALTDSVKKHACGNVNRELVPETVHVYRMEGFGALEMGVHRFRQIKQESAAPVAEGKFICLWQYKDGNWNVTRIIIYDFHSVPK